MQYRNLDQIAQRRWSTPSGCVLSPPLRQSYPPWGDLPTPGRFSPTLGDLHNPSPWDILGLDLTRLHCNLRNSCTCTFCMEHGGPCLTAGFGVFNITWRFMAFSIYVRCDGAHNPTHNPASWTSISYPLVTRVVVHRAMSISMSIYYAKPKFISKLNFYSRQEDLVPS